MEDPSGVQEANYEVDLAVNWRLSGHRTLS